jgi:hypothetical protein
VKKRVELGLEIEIDKLTNSIENVKSGLSFRTEVTQLRKSDWAILTDNNYWQFHWELEFDIPNREIYKLSLANELNVIQGLMSIEEKKDYIFIHLIESASFNIGNSKAFLGVPGNLVAFACQVSFDRGGEGYVSFLSKSKLIKHYEESLGAIHIGGQNMVITSETAMNLINKYFS